MPRVTGLVVTIDSENYYRGHQVYLNGVQVAHRPYDGSDPIEVERDVIVAFGSLLRQVTGWTEENEEEDPYA